jgi:hypothetical protein
MRRDCQQRESQLGSTATLESTGTNGPSQTILSLEWFSLSFSI